MNPLVIQCCQCRRVKAGEEFVPASPVPGVRVSHGYCPECFAVAMRAIEAEAASPIPLPGIQQAAA